MSTKEHLVDRGTDGQQFHPNIKEDDVLYVFATDACCSLPFVYEV